MIRRLTWVIHCFSPAILGVLIPWLWFGENVLLYQYAVQVVTTVTEMGITAGGQALSPALHRWFVSGTFIGASSMGDWSDAALLVTAPFVKPIVLFIVLLCLIKMAWMQRYRTFDATTVFIWMILIHLLLQPGWVHYFCWLPFVHVWCWCKAKGRPKILWLAALAILERLPPLF